MKIFAEAQSLRLPEFLVKIIVKRKKWLIDNFIRTKSDGLSFLNETLFFENLLHEKWVGDFFFFCPRFQVLILLLNNMSMFFTKFI